MAPYHSIFQNQQNQMLNTLNTVCSQMKNFVISSLFCLLIAHMFLIITTKNQ